MIYIVCFLAAFLGTLLATIFSRKTSIASLVPDHPNHRSLHSTTIPRVGGLGIAIGLSCAIAVQLYEKVSFGYLINFTLFGYIVLLGVSLVDDVKPQSALTRIMIHSLVALAWAYSSFEGQIGLQVLIIAILVTWGANLFNFMDGSDGLAGSMALFGFGAYAFAASIPDQALSTLSFSVCGACAAFLVFNWPPAKIFLGDSGSIPIGFLATAIGIAGIVSEIWHPLFPLMVFGMFWVDATFTLITRILKSEKFWESHNNHWYQKAIRSGVSHRNVLLIHLVCNGFIAILSLAWLKHPVFSNPIFQVFAILLVFLIPCGFGIWAERKFKHALTHTVAPL
jgi:UDP-GlcNAc:undecaprenyl-phosphate/decaprenyl-phosphate GlcNAc-1-phosphate transferase